MPKVADNTGVLALEALAARPTLETQEPSPPHHVRPLAQATTEPLYPAEALPEEAVYQEAPETPYPSAHATRRTVVVPSRELTPKSNGISEIPPPANQGDRPPSVRITPLVARPT
ncbi:hypothetical protein PUR61_06715, partial [Streptomyces sp. BE20]|uniref:hypothetical protein n=1 Tax=Streptomyces sp. BE20 TaxID=3002525 RepID=UPI002E77955D